MLAVVRSTIADASMKEVQSIAIRDGMRTFLARTEKPENMTQKEFADLIVEAKKMEDDLENLEPLWLAHQDRTFTEIRALWFAIYGAINLNPTVNAVVGSTQSWPLRFAALRAAVPQATAEDIKLVFTELGGTVG